MDWLVTLLILGVFFGGLGLFLLSLCAIVEVTRGR